MITDILKLKSNIELHMQAIILERYGSPEVLQLKEVPRPTPGKNEVLIKIHATAINDYDWSMVRGKPYAYRLLFGLFKPKHAIPGMEVAGTVEALGENATTFKVGDPVYGDTSEYGFGTLAEYICINEKAVIPKPESMPFEEAAALPHAALLAWQGLVDLGTIQKGQKILINGAGGGVGTLGLQIARQYDAEVTGVDTGEKLKMMEAIGFDHVIDYRKEDFTKLGQRYDLILDAKTTRSPSAYARVLSPGGKYVTVGGKLMRMLQLLFSRKFGRKNFHILPLKPNKGLNTISKLYEEGKIKPQLDGPYSLEEVPRLIQYFGEGKHSGKIVISINYTR